jgi:hypothetical protein
MRFTAYKGFVNFYNALKRFVERLILDSIANPMQHVPRRFLCYLNISRKLATRNSLAMRGEYVDSHEPLLQWQGGIFKDRTDSHCELLQAFGALVKLSVIDTIDFFRVLAMRTYRLTVPSRLSKIFSARLFIGKAFAKINEVVELGFCGFNNLFHNNSNGLFVPLVIYEINYGLSSI